MKSMKQKRMEAAERKTEYDNLSLLERLNRIELRPGNCKKEREKLYKLINKAQGGDYYV